ncbi:MAG: response regulator [Candidatus Margulisiibacteriota bacterium]
MAHVLVIDDQESMRSIISQMLKDNGHQVTTAEDGEEGLRIFEGNPSSFNLVMCDVNMPKIDGFEFLKRVKSSHPKSAVILLTGTNEDIARYVGKEYKADAILKKPFVVEDVMQIVEMVIASTR